MALTTLDPTTALVVIDLQEGIVSLPLARPADEIVARAVTLLGAFRDRGLPVVLVNVDGTPPGRTEQSGRSLAGAPAEFSRLVADLDQQPEDLVVTKRSRGAVTHTGLEERLRERGVTQVVLVGIATSAGVESTGRDAHERGFHVTLVVDAMTDRDLDAHRRSIAAVFPRIGETGTTQDVLDLLAVLPHG